jgi:hypothetical protein
MVFSKSVLFLAGISMISAFRNHALLGEHEESRGLADPSSYQDAFNSPGVYSAPSNLLERKPTNRVHYHRHDVSPSFLQTKESMERFLHPFATLQEAKAAALKLQTAEEQRQDRQAMLRSRIDVFRSELESQIANAKKEKHMAEERMAKRGMGPSSFAQSALKTDFESRELEKISEMQRSWKLAADRLAHAELAANSEPNAAVIDANTRVEADRKRMARLSSVINEDLDRVARDASLVAADEERMKKEQALRDLK